MVNVDAGSTQAVTLPGASTLPPAKPATTSTPAKPVKVAGSSPVLRPGGRFETVNAFIDYTMRELTPAARSVWFILWRDTKANGQARTGQADLARRSGVSTRAVNTAIKELATAGILKVVRKGGVRSGATTYKVRSMNPRGTE